MTSAQRKKEVIEFRRTHFIMGKHPTTQMSSSSYAQRMRPGLKDPRQGQQQSTAALQASHFSIGGRVHKESQYGTTYNIITGAMPNRGPMKLQRVALKDVPATKTSITLGKGNPYSYKTSNKAHFANVKGTAT